MSEDKFKRFGKYLILDHLVDGGMATICRAKFLGEQANKIVAIKMVQPQFSKDPSFVQMFEDELKVTFGLLHPNIVQMTDYGMIDGQLYSAMEYVDGANLKEYLDRLKEKNFVFPVGISTYIISQVCQALQYAHTFTDKLSGKPFNIIHRDISPHNIMLTYDGSVKVIDFGIAKADSNSEATQAGTIKGKLSYLAPEYLDGLELDARYDLFAVGITLWELLCSRKLFTATNDLAVLKQIQACKVPRPSSINPNVPKELDEIVLKALSKDRNNRYDNMDQFNRALVKFLYSTYPDFNATDLSYFSHQLFKEEIASDKKKFVEYGDIDVTPYLKEISSAGEEVTRTAPNKLRSKSIELDFNIEDTNIEEVKLDVKVKPPAPPSSAIKPPATNRVAGTRTNLNRTSATRTRNISKSRTDKKSNTNKSGSGAFVKFAVVASLAAVAFFKADTIKNMTGFDLKEKLGLVDTNSNRKVANTKASTVEYGKVTLVNYDSSMVVKINGSIAQINGIVVKVPLDKELKLSIFKNGTEQFSTDEFSLSSDDNYKRVVIPDLQDTKIGILSTSMNFTTGSKLIISNDDRTIEKDLPFENFRLPAGRYNATISNPLLGTEREVVFEVVENRKVFLE